MENPRPFLPFRTRDGGGSFPSTSSTRHYLLFAMMDADPTSFVVWYSEASSSCWTVFSRFNCGRYRNTETAKFETANRILAVQNLTRCRTGFVYAIFQRQSPHRSSKSSTQPSNIHIIAHKNQCLQILIPSSNPTSLTCE